MERNRDSRMGRDVAMDSATEAEGSVLLQDETAQEGLARFCLEPDTAETRRSLAWVNAICLAYLVIGLMGLRPPPIYVAKRPLPEEAVPTVIEPLVSTVQQADLAFFKDFVEPVPEKTFTARTDESARPAAAGRSEQ